MKMTMNDVKQTICRNRATLLWVIAALAVQFSGNDFARAQGPEHVVYSAQRGLWMGGNTPMPPMDYYLTLGRNHGLQPGSVIEVMRRQSTYDVVNKKLHKDLTFSIARLRVIHAETGASIARLDTMVPENQRPALTPNGVAIGDLVRLVR